jgi:predicted dehydrogenase
MAHTILMEYEPDAMLMVESHFNNIVRGKPLHRYEWFVDGTDGSLLGTSKEVVVSLKGEKEPRRFPIEGNWFPDAFGGSMGELMQAVTEDREPATSGADNLSSIKIAYAAVESARTGRAVELAEIGA